MDTAAQRVPPPEAGAREVARVTGADGIEAALLHSPGLLDDGRLRAAVLEAVRLAVQRLGLAGEAAAQADALAASRLRLVTAIARERERFAADVQAGPDMRLSEAAVALQDALRTAPPQLAALVNSAVDDLDGARAELAGAVDGDVAARVAAHGLDAALVELARRAGATADARIGAVVDTEVSVAAWFCVSEALANALKHAGTAQIGLSAWRTDDRLVVEVVDDGPGGADPAGAGLAGLRARATALDGEFDLDSAPGAGTRVAVRLPLNPPGATASPS